MTRWVELLLKCEKLCQPLLRRLGHLPNLLSLTYSTFSPIRTAGSIAAATNRMVALTRQKGRRMAAWRNENLIWIKYLS